MYRDAKRWLYIKAILVNALGVGGRNAAAADSGHPLGSPCRWWGKAKSPATRPGCDL